MKFLFVAQRFHTNLYYRVIALQNAGHEVKVCALYKGKSEYLEGINLEVIELSFLSKVVISIYSLFIKKGLKSAFELRIQSPDLKLKKVIEEYHPDVIVLKAYQNSLALKTLMIARRSKIKVLMLTQTTFTHIKGSEYLFRLNIKLFKWLGVYAYLTPIKSNYEAFMNFGIENVFYQPFVFPAATHITHHQSNENSKYIKILSIGKYVKRKDHLLLIKACHKLISMGYPIQLNVYGEISDDEYFIGLKKYIKNNNLEESVAIFTNEPYIELLQKYQKHDIFVLPGYGEPAAYSPVEAMAYGLPVIVSSECGTKCYINDGENGFIFKAKNLLDLIDKLKLMISDKEKLRIMSKNALIAAKDNHNLENFSETITKIIDN